MNAVASIIWFADAVHFSPEIIGEKGVDFGRLHSLKLPIPDGFIIPSSIFQKLLTPDHIHKIELDLQTIQIDQPETLVRASEKIKNQIMRLEIPQALAIDISNAYHKIGEHEFVALRSSKTNGQLPSQHATWLNVHGDANVIDSVRKIWASMFEPKMLLHISQHLTPLKHISQAIVVQRMTQSRVSGVAYSKNPETNNKRSVVIDAIWGLGEYLLDYMIQADRYEVEKNTWNVIQQGKHPQQYELVRKEGMTEEFEIPESRKFAAKLREKELKEIAELAVKAQQLLFFPQRLEWAYEGDTLYILQTQQLTETFSQQVMANANDERLGHLAPLLYGSSVQEGLISGRVRVCRTEKDFQELKPGEILVTAKLPSLHLHLFRSAAGIICDTPLFPRDVFSLGIPCVANTHFGTSALKTGQFVTVYGQQGTVYEGSLDYAEPKNSQASKPLHFTKVLVSTGEPEAAKHISTLDVDGIGLLRAEFMFASLGIHPKKLIKEHKEDILIQTLVSGIRKLCDSVKQKPVYYRFIDFTSQEFLQLEGGKEYEKPEENPILGYRGGLRYMSNISSFDIELSAIAQLKEEGYDNLHIMIPFLRSVDELVLLKKHLAQYDLIQSKKLELWMMVDVPAVALGIDRFLEQGVDGVAIGAKDLISLFTGIVPSDNTAFTTSYFDQPAVQQLMQHIVKTCQNFSRPVIFCEHQLNQKMIEFLLSIHVDGISVNRKQVQYVKALIER